MMISEIQHTLIASSNGMNYTTDEWRDTNAEVQQQTYQSEAYKSYEKMLKLVEVKAT